MALVLGITPQLLLLLCRAAQRSARLRRRRASAVCPACLGSRTQSSAYRMV